MNYIPIRIGTLRPDNVISFDVYVQVAEKYIHYIRQADAFDGDRISKLKAKGIKKLFIAEEAEALYLQYLDAGLDQLKDTKIETVRRETIVRDTMVTDAENAERNVQTEQGYQRTEDRMKKVVEFLTSSESVARNIMSAAGFSQDNFQHCANVSTLALGMANLLGITKTSDLVEIGLAALLHDIAYSKFDFNARVPLDQMSVEQLNKYKEHPIEGARMLADKPYVTKGVLELIADHEEIGEGLGFPNKKRLSTMRRSSQILNLANDYDRYAHLKQKSHKEIAKQFFQDKIGAFDLNHIKFLVSLFKN